MTRLKRTETQAQTRSRLLDAALDLFRREGYATTSVERIAETAGYSKGAFYSNFTSKEAVFLEILETAGAVSLNELCTNLESTTSAQAAIELLAHWADDRSKSGNWALTILEHARLAPDGSSLKRQEDIIRGHWRKLGKCLTKRFGLKSDPETLGALLHEIAYAPAMTLVANPTAGSLMRLAMATMI